MALTDIYGTCDAERLDEFKKKKKIAVVWAQIFTAWNDPHALKIFKFITLSSSAYVTVIGSPKCRRGYIALLFPSPFSYILLWGGGVGESSLPLSGIIVF